MVPVRGISATYVYSTPCVHPECGSRAGVFHCTHLANNGFGGSVISRVSEMVTAPTVSKFRICVFARHKQAWLTGEKKKSRSKLVLVSMVKESAFYTVWYTVVILTGVGPLHRGTCDLLLLGWDFRACTLEEINYSPDPLFPQNGNIPLIIWTSITGAAMRDWSFCSALGRCVQAGPSSFP